MAPLEDPERLFRAPGERRGRQRGAGGRRGREGEELPPVHLPGLDHGALLDEWVARGSSARNTYSRYITLMATWSAFVVLVLQRVTARNHSTPSA